MSGWPGCLSWVQPFLQKRPGGLHYPLSPKHSASLSPLTIHISYVSLSNDPRDSAAASMCTHTHTPHTLTHTRAHTCTPTRTRAHTQVRTYKRTYMHTYTHKGTQAHTHAYRRTHRCAHIHTKAHPGQTPNSTPIPCLNSKPAGLFHPLGQSPHPCPLAVCSAWNEGSLGAKH